MTTVSSVSTCPASDFPFSLLAIDAGHDINVVNATHNDDEVDIMPCSSVKRDLYLPTSGQL
jgi:hypothetical protein